MKKGVWSVVGEDFPSSFTDQSLPVDMQESVQTDDSKGKSMTHLNRESSDEKCDECMKKMGIYAK